MILNVAEIRALVHLVTKRTGLPVHDEDLEQEVALHAVEAFRRIERVAHPRALLAKIVVDTVGDYWRRRRPREDIQAIDERLLSHVPTFETDLDARRQIDLLRRALDRLPESKRAVIDLFYTQGHSIPEIALLRRMSVSAVKMELSRSRRALARIVRFLANKKSR